MGGDSSGRPQGVLGAVLAGGASSRFGSPKALARVGGRSLLERVLQAVLLVTEEVLLVANDPAVAAAWEHALPDDVPARGPLGGVATALRVAADRRLGGALCVACDLPFVSVELLRSLLAEVPAAPGHVVLPESTGPRGAEPLCAYYPVTALPEVEEALGAGRRAPHLLLDRLPSRRLPLARVLEVGDPETLFFNVNTPADLERAERIAAAGG